MTVERDLPSEVKAAIVDASNSPSPEKDNQKPTLVDELASASVDELMSASFNIGMSILDGAATSASAVCSITVDVVGAVLGGIADNL